MKTKLVKPTDPSGIIKNLIKTAGGADVLARSMRSQGHVTQMNAPKLQSWAKPPVDPSSIDPITKTARMIESTGSLLPLQWLCGRLGCCFVPGQAAFNTIHDKGPQTWFAASIQLHELRRTVIRAFLSDNPSSYPEITDEEGRLIAKTWSTVMSWVEGFLRSYRPDAKELSTIPAYSESSRHTLFLTTSSWRIMTEILHDKSREEISEKIGHPFGGPKRNRAGDLCYPLTDTLHKWAQSRGEDGCTSSGSRGPLDYTLAICHAGRSLEPIAWLAEKSGGYLVLPPPPRLQNQAFDGLLQFWERTMVELAELDASVARSLLDKKIQPEELIQLQTEWQDVIDWMTGFVEDW